MRYISMGVLGVCAYPYTTMIMCSACTCIKQYVYTTCVCVHVCYIYKTESLHVCTLYITRVFIVYM